MSVALFFFCCLIIACMMVWLTPIVVIYVLTLTFGRP